jgi:hypothetical protein
MTKSLSLLSALLLLSCSRPSSPAPESKPAAEAPRPGAEAAAAPIAPPPEVPRCSARVLNAEPRAPRTPLPPAVEAMRRRIIAAAVACDYAALATLSREKGESFNSDSGAEKDLAVAWSKREKEGEPVLEHLVRVLNMPHTQLDTLYVWPSAYSAEPTPEDWEALKDVYSSKQLAELRANPEGYAGFRTGIDESGDWKYAFSGD